MRWIDDRESENVEDRRGVGGGFHVGIGGIGAIVVVLVGLFLGVDPSTFLALLSGNETQQQKETRRADDGGYGFLAHA
jgi:predicted metalloprotease